MLGRLFSMLIFTPPGLPLWASYLILVMKVTVVVILVRRNLAPLLLTKLSEHLRARSISMRSVRGLYVKSKDRIWRIERISWSLSIFSQKHISIKITGLALEIIPGPERDRRVSVDRRSPSLSIYSLRLLKRMLRKISAIIPSKLTQNGRRSVGSIYRRTLVTLIQTMNFELDTVTISTSSFPGTKVIIGNITFNSTIDFPSLRKEVDIQNILGERPNRRFSMAVARDILTGREDVEVSLTVDISEITGKTSIISQDGPDRHLPEQVAVYHEDVFFYVPGIVHFKLDFGYDSLAHGLSSDTVITSISIPRCDVFLDKVNSILSSTSRDYYDPSTMINGVEDGNYRQKHKTLHSTYINALKSFNIQAECVNLFQSNPSKPLRLLAVKRLDLMLWPSSGFSSSIHRKWLGSKDRGLTLGLTLRVDEINIHRWSSQSSEIAHCSMAMHRIDINAIFHKWPIDWAFMPSRPDILDDPLVIWEISLESIFISDQFSFFLAGSDVSIVDRPPSVSEKSFPKIMLPKINFDLFCHTLSVDLYEGESISSSEATYSLATSNISLHLDSAFNDLKLAARSVPSNLDVRILEINSYLSSGPMSIRSCLKESNAKTLTGHDPLITIDQISGCITGRIATTQIKSTESIALHPEDSILYIKIFLDNVLLDFWRKDNVSLVRSLRRIFPPSSKTTKTPKHPLFNYAFHIGVHHVTLAVTGLDINPNCELGLSRGVEFDGGWALQVLNCRRAACTSRLLEEVLDQELINDAQSAASESNNSLSSSSNLIILSCVLHEFICSPITANSFEYGRNGCSRDDALCSLLTVPRLRLNAISLDQSITLKVVNYDTTIRSYIDLLGIYSIFLVSQTFRECFESEINSGHNQVSPSSTAIFNMQLHAFNVRCHLPLAQEIFFRVEEISIKNTSTCILNVSATTMDGYVPKEREKWEPLLKLSNTSFQILRNAKQSFAVIVHGLRFSIPHEFIFSELLVNVTIAIKALRHLQSIVQNGRHIPFPTPSAEVAKILPNIDIRINCLVLEVMDNPFDGKIARISRVGPVAQKQRLEREQAFKAKVRNLRMEDETDSDGDLQDEYPYKFTSKRTVSVPDARDRLKQIHALSWFKAVSREEEKIALLEESILKILNQAQSSNLLPISVTAPDKIPPLFRAIINGFNLCISPLNKGNTPLELGNMPKSTQYTLFIPFHMRCALDSARISLRDYPLPLLNIPVTPGNYGLEVESDVVIAEELGSHESVEWFTCPIIPVEFDIIGCKGYFLDIPKTIMPVKSYADLQLNFHSSVTEFTWGISYSPAVQDILRIVETLTPTPADPSPAIGFWDKLRLILHWRITAIFDGMACLHFKGSHDPYQLSGFSTGFDFRWDGNVILRINHKNAERELIQLISDSMAIIIPCSKSLLGLQKTLQDNISAQWDPSITWCLDEYEKLCAEFSHGIKWGIGFVLERTCNSTSCHSCNGDTFNRSCRFFTFSPHYEVVLRKGKNSSHDPVDSYYGFRSNFIHLSTSLISPLKDISTNTKNAFHLTPKTFTHFWSWWSLFDDGISLPIRQGRIFPDFRLPTQKFSQHLATVKYRIEFSSIFIAHTYKLDTVEDWKQGLTRCIGIKAFLDSFQADLHQRLEEKPRSQSQKQKSKVVRHRPFYAIDVILTGLDLRSLMARFSEPEKQLINPDFATNSTKFWDGFTPSSPSSDWIDFDDFKETDWEIPETKSTFYLYQTASCPRFVYFKRVPIDPGMNSTNVKFGDEATHVCLMGKEPSIQEVQLQFGIKRLLDLRKQMVARDQGAESHNILDEGGQNRKQMVNLLEEYIQHSSATLNRLQKHSTSYIPANITLPEDIRNFVNVYQVHCPVIHLNNATRDILHEYYIASRARRGFEYHLSARAVKFIRDQEFGFLAAGPNDTITDRRPRSGSVHIAAKAVKRILARESREGPDDPNGSESLLGWEPGISERKAHLCLLLKPQVVLKSNHTEDFALLLVADHVVLRNHGIVDDANIDDPISGHIMQRNFANINGLQMFQPVSPALTTQLPFEIFLDVRCESSEFQRIVPQTHATLRYDSFNKLRLRNNVTTLSSTLKQNQGTMDHLLYEMDLLGIEVPRFTVAADASAFSTMSSIVNDLLLFSDPARKARSLQLENMIFGYDFTDYQSAAKVVSDLQSRLRWRLLLDEFYNTRDCPSIPTKNVLENKAYILKLSDELNMIFDAFKLAQIHTDDRTHDQKSALRLHTFSSEISWRMLGDNRQLIAKLAVRGINFSWLRRQDGSTTSVLQVEDLQAFDGSPNALWPEILTKYNEPLNHYMVKRGLFMKGQWSVLAPVGGISIYSDFKIELHPIRLTLETQLGNKILAYILPGRRKDIEEPISDHNSDDSHGKAKTEFSIFSSQSNRRLLTSRSMSNLTLMNAESQTDYHAPGLPKSRSSAALVVTGSNGDNEVHAIPTSNITLIEDGDVYQMRYRSNQKTFVHAEIPSVHVLLSIVKGGGFLIRDARLRTHDLEWRNRTSSLEELIEHFVPSDPSWRGWVKVAWQQPIFSVGNVVKELVTKTQWGRIGKHAEDEDKSSRT